jgi:hypothetical protein
MSNGIVTIPTTPKPSTYQGSPHISADGRFVTYVEWSDSDLASIYIVRLSDKQAWRVPTIGRGRYAQPKFSTNMDRIAYLRLGADLQSGSVDSAHAGLYVHTITIDAGGIILGNPEKVYGPCNSFSFASDDASILVTDGDYPQTTLASISPVTKAAAVVAQSVYATDIRLSPDQKWVAFIEFRNVHVAPFTRPMTPEGLSEPMNVTALGAKKFAVNDQSLQLTTNGGDWLSWSANSQKLRWGSSRSLS